mmetsp:Transcript_79618/g.182386  ORF Transcript_79618/g.182386 Transcript_79618/m.182386 type:complete len:334 (+) Transcript_79618:1110-2111(+)
MVNLVYEAVFGPEDFVFQAGSAASEMIIVVRGRVQLFVPDDTRKKRVGFRASRTQVTTGTGQAEPQSDVLGPRSWFGESSLFCPTVQNRRRVASAQCMTFCSVIVVSRENFDEALAVNSEWRDATLQLRREVAAGNSDFLIGLKAVANVNTQGAASPKHRRWSWSSGSRPSQFRQIDSSAPPLQRLTTSAPRNHILQSVAESEHNSSTEDDARPAHAYQRSSNRALSSSEIMEDLSRPSAMGKEVGRLRALQQLKPVTRAVQHRSGKTIQGKHSAGAILMSMHAEQLRALAAAHSDGLSGTRAVAAEVAELRGAFQRDLELACSRIAPKVQDC